MLFLALLCIFGVVAGDSVCPERKGVDNVDEDSFVEEQKKWFMHLKLVNPWENGTDCSFGTFNPKEKTFAVNSVKDKKHYSFGGTYVFDKELGIINFTSPTYEETTGVPVLSLTILYYDEKSVIAYACNDNDGSMHEYVWASTRSRIMDENEKKKLEEQISKLNIDTSQIMTIDQSEETCGAN